MEENSESTEEIRLIRYIVNGDQLKSMGQSELNLPPDVCEGFWSLNTHNQRLQTPSDALLSSYCPQMIGPCCTPIRRKDFCRLFMSFTFWLMIAQIVVFVLTLLETRSPLEKATIDNPVLLKYGAINAYRIKIRHEYWRLLTTLGVHSTIAHVIVNIMIEFIFMLSRESSWNPARLVSVFLLSSVACSFWNMVVAPQVTGAGPTGAIFGVFGSFVSSYLISFEALEWRHRIATLFLICVIVVMLIFAGNERPDDGVGCLAGLIFGVGFGFILFARKNSKKKSRVLLYIIGVSVSFVVLVPPIGYFLLKTDVSNP